jgi:hypothetical protein
MLLAILRNLLSDPVHVYLLSGDVLATIAVGLGIIWEHGPPEVQRVANRLIIGGVLVETICSIWLFAYDENISAGQQSVIRFQNDKIIALEASIAPRTINIDAFSKALEGKPIPTDVQILELIGASDVQMFAIQLAEALKINGWKARIDGATADDMHRAGFNGWAGNSVPSGVVVYGERSKALVALVTALKTSTDPVGFEFPRPLRAPPEPKGRIIVAIFAKP